MSTATLTRDQVQTKPKAKVSDNSKGVTIELRTNLTQRSDLATVSIPAVATLAKLPFSPGVQKTTAQFPLDMQAVDISIFFRGGTDEVRVRANIIAEYLEEIHFVQDSPEHVTVHIVHPHDAEIQCTVYCAATGESRSGMGACIDCPGPKGSVKICC